MKPSSISQSPSIALASEVCSNNLAPRFMIFVMRNRKKARWALVRCFVNKWTLDPICSLLLLLSNRSFGVVLVIVTVVVVNTIELLLLSHHRRRHLCLLRCFFRHHGRRHLLLPRCCFRHHRRRHLPHRGFHPSIMWEAMFGRSRKRDGSFVSKQNGKSGKGGIRK